MQSNDGSHGLLEMNSGSASAERSMSGYPPRVIDRAIRFTALGTRQAARSHFPSVPPTTARAPQAINSEICIYLICASQMVA